MGTPLQARPGEDALAAISCKGPYKAETLKWNLRRKSPCSNPLEGTPLWGPLNRTIWIHVPRRDPLVGTYGGDRK